MQIDHTTVDLIVVDEVTRQPIGRPVLTFAIDVHTRVVTGFYLALDYPSTLRAGVCVAQSVFEKEAWLAERGIDLPWPATGLPRAAHVDNAGEFHSTAFTRALEDFGVEVIYRPIARPHFGGHVERLIGTTMGAVHLLRGTTFSSIKARGDYPAEARATTTHSSLFQHGQTDSRGDLADWRCGTSSKAWVSWNTATSSWSRTSSPPTDSEMSLRTVYGS